MPAGRAAPGIPIDGLLVIPHLHASEIAKMPSDGAQIFVHHEKTLEPLHRIPWKKSEGGGTV